MKYKVGSYRGWDALCVAANMAAFFALILFSVWFGWVGFLLTVIAWCFVPDPEEGYGKLFHNRKENNEE